MFSSTNFWMGFAGLLYLVAGVFMLRKEINAARGWNKLILLGSVFFAASLAAFAPEHFYGGPEYIQSMAPSWMPVRSFWPYFVGCALLAAATSLTLRKFVRLSSTLLGLMFFLFVCMIYLPSLLAHLKNRLAWIFALRDLSFAAGAWALAGLYSRGSSPRLSKWMILFARIVVAPFPREDNSVKCPGVGIVRMIRQPLVEERQCFNSLASNRERPRAGDHISVRFLRARWWRSCDDTCAGNECHR